LKKQLIQAEKLIRTAKYWRFVEIIPGALTWTAFLFIIFGSFLWPFLTANLIITYTLIWVFRTFHFSYNLTKSFHYSQRAQKTNWGLLLKLIENPEKILKIIKKEKYFIDPLVLREKKGPVEEKLYQKILELKQKKQYLKPNEVIHCITLMTAKESYEVLKTSIDSYIKSQYDLKKVIFMLGCEESDWKNALEISLRLRKEYGHLFKAYLHSFHPKNLPNELVGRAGNATWAAKTLKRYLDNNKIEYSKVILSSFDADTVISPDFLNELTFRYCITENRIEVGYQPVPFYHNNIWDVPVFNRLVAISCSFWQLSVSLRTDENKSFSSRSMSFQSVLDFDYWDAKVVQDDSRQYWTAFFVYEGRHYLENIFSPVYMDAVLSDSYLKTLKSQYKQLRRWAWGVSDFPFIVFNMIKSKNIPLSRKIYEILHFLESVFFWATGPILMLFAGAIPSMVNRNFGQSILSLNLPLYMSYLLNISSLGILVCLIITTQIIPFDKQKRLIRKVSLFLQWLLVPIVSVTLSSIPAIDAQTRLMLNQRLDFQVTQKSRKK
jgi:hypothetical protein